MRSQKLSHTQAGRHTLTLTHTRTKTRLGVEEFLARKPKKEIWHIDVVAAAKTRAGILSIVRIFNVFDHFE